MDLGDVKEEMSIRGCVEVIVNLVLDRFAQEVEGAGYLEDFWCGW